MRKPIHTTEERDDSLSLTPMIDVTFLLLIFFLLTLQFRQLDGKLSSSLPPDAGAKERSELREDLVIELFVVRPGLRVERATGRPLAPDEEVRPVDLIGREVGYRLVGSASDFSSLVARLRTIPDPPPTVLVRSGPGIVYGDVVELLDTLIECGYHDVRFARSRR